VVLTGSSLLYQALSGCPGSACLVVQCRQVKITILGDEGVPVQVDGEAWIQPPGVVNIIHKNRAQMLTRDRVGHTSGTCPSLCDYLSVCLSVLLSVCLSVCLSVSPSVCTKCVLLPCLRPRLLSPARLPSPPSPWFHQLARQGESLLRVYTRADWLIAQRDIITVHGRVWWKHDNCRPLSDKPGEVKLTMRVSLLPDLYTFSYPIWKKTIQFQ